MTRTGSRFRRVEPRRRTRAFVLGLLAELPRKNCWTIAEHAGDPSPDGMQHLLARAKWDADGVRDDTRCYVIEHLGTGRPVIVCARSLPGMVPRWPELACHQASLAAPAMPTTGATVPEQR